MPSVICKRNCVCSRPAEPRRRIVNPRPDRRESIKSTGSRPLPRRCSVARGVLSFPRHRTDDAKTRVLLRRETGPTATAKMKDLLGGKGG